MNSGPPAAVWQVASEYSALMLCDRRAFAWEWLRRTPRYRRLWAARDRLPIDAPIRVGLLAWIERAAKEQYIRDCDLRSFSAAEDPQRLLDLITQK